MKRKSTKEILAESFRELAEKRQVNKITIQEIVDNCNYSPATFYRHFRDKYDLIAWDYAHQTSEIMSRVGTDSYEWRDTLTDGIHFFMNNKEYMQNLLRNTGGHDSFVRYFSETNIEYLSKCIMSLSKSSSLDKEMLMLIRIYCFGTVLLTCQWLLDELECDCNQLAELYEKALPEAMRNILCKK